MSGRSLFWITPMVLSDCIHSYRSAKISLSFSCMNMVVDTICITDTVVI